MPFWNYVSSFEIAFPPIIILIATYGVAFFMGKNLADIPSGTIAYLRNYFFQSRKMMVYFLIFSVAVSFFTLRYTERNPPPYYDRLVAAILAGEIDRSEEASNLISIVADKNPLFADQLGLVTRVFEIRRAINLEAETFDVVTSRLLLRSLASSHDEAWLQHPLRKHALAEAHSLVAEGISQSSSIAQDFGEFSPGHLFDEAVRLYSEVRDTSPKRLSTSQLIASAQSNIGNVHFYRREFEDALDAWQATLDKYPEHKNVGTLANMIAAHVVLKNFDAAIQLGGESRRWAETNGKAIQDTSHYVSILVNTGFAYIGNGETEASKPLFEFAASIEDDDNTKLNLALIFSMSGEAERAEKILREVSAPVTHKDISDDISLTSDQRCSYLWWALYSPDIDLRDVAARLFVFLGEKHTSAELQKFSDLEDLAALRVRVANELDQFPGSCSSYSLIDPIVNFVRGG